MRRQHIINQFRFIALLILTTLAACQNKPVSTNQPNDLPRVILWAWERPENLEFADPNKFAVAFLAQTLVLQNDEVVFRPRRQPLKVNERAKLIAVTRIEAQKVNGQSAKLSDEQRQRIVELVLKTLDLKSVGAIQIDFDAAVSEREFYRGLLDDLRAKLPPDVPLSMTALASFCIGDKWISDLPVAEAVPMIFRMGADDKNIKNYLANGNDFRVSVCQKSYGIALDEPLRMKFDNTRRLYVFNNRAWRAEDLSRLP